MKSPTASTTEITVTIPDNNFSPLPPLILSIALSNFVSLLSSSS